MAAPAMRHSTSLPAVTPARGSIPDGTDLFSKRKASKPERRSTTAFADVGGGGGMIARAKRSSMSQNSTRRKAPPFLRRSDDDPNTGEWTRFSSTKNAAFFAALDADIAMAEQMLKHGGGARHRWQSGAAKALGKAPYLKLGIGGKMAQGWDGALSEDAIQVLRDEKEADFAKEVEQNYDHLFEMLLEEEAEAVSWEATTEEVCRLLTEEMLRKQADRMAEEVITYGIERELMRKQLIAEEAALLAATREAALMEAARAAKAAADASADATAAEDASLQANSNSLVEVPALESRDAADLAEEAAAHASLAAERPDVILAEKAATEAEKHAEDAAKASAKALAAADELAAKIEEARMQAQARPTTPESFMARGGGGGGGGGAWRQGKAKAPMSLVMAFATGAAPGEAPAYASGEDEQPEELASRAWRRQLSELESADAIRRYDMFGGGIANFIARRPSAPMISAAHTRTGPPVLGPKAAEDRGCVRFLLDTMEGGPSHLLPVVAIDDLREVLHHACTRPERWGRQLLGALFTELSMREANLFSTLDVSGAVDELPQLAPQPAWRDDFEEHAREEWRPGASPYLKLKRKIVVVHVLNSSGAELVQAKYAEVVTPVEREEGGGSGLRVGLNQPKSMYDAVAPFRCRRLSGRLTDGTPPMRLVVNLIRSKMGIPESSVKLLDAEPAVTLIEGRCQYPGLGCESMFYVVRISVNKLPSHAFRAKGVEWDWIRTRAKLRPEAISWSQRPETAATPGHLAEMLRRSQQPLPIRENLRTPATPSLSQAQLLSPLRYQPEPPRGPPRSFGEARQQAWLTSSAVTQSVSHSELPALR